MIHSLPYYLLSVLRAVRLSDEATGHQLPSFLVLDTTIHSDFA